MPALPEFAGEESGAIAPLYALALFGLIGMAGIGWDYGRLAALDSELQNAADHAAIASATQLDGTAGAMDRARKAANDYFANAASDFVNKTRMANDGQGRPITSLSFTFYDGYNSATDTLGNQLTDDADSPKAKVVQVTVNGRKAFYALTPVVGALSNSGDLTASAVAGMESTVCKVPPLMICNPNEAAGRDFPTAADEGIGLRLEPGPGNTSWGPGNYGFLNFGDSGASALEKYLGANTDIAPCADLDTISTQPGQPTTVSAAINTRFDIYDNGLTSYCTRGNGQCSPAMNTRKDLVHITGTANSDFPQQVQDADCRVQTANGNPSNTDGELVLDATKITGNTSGWTLPSVKYVPGGATPTNMGFPRDDCHAGSYNGTCTKGNFGDGLWAYSTYFNVNYGSANGPTLLSQAVAASGRSSASKLTRYDVYKWEIATSHTGPGPAVTIQQLNPQGNPTGKTKTFKSFSAPICAAGKAESAANGVKDRRVLTAAVVNCTAQGIKGSTPITQAPKWVDLFLTEPSVNRNGLTKANQIYVEVIGPGTRPGGGDAYQYFGRNKPVLLR
jgi:Flp pilus assembly protein TadG